MKDTAAAVPNDVLVDIDFGDGTKDEAMPFLVGTPYEHVYRGLFGLSIYMYHECW